LFPSFGVEMDVSVHLAATLPYRADLLSVTSAGARGSSAVNHDRASVTA